MFVLARKRAALSEVLNSNGDVVGYVRSGEHSTSVPSGESSAQRPASAAPVSSAVLLSWGAIVTLLVLAFGIYLSNGPDDVSFPAPVANMDPEASGNGWNGVDVNYFGVISFDGRVIGSVWDGSGDARNAEYLDGIRDLGERSALISEGLQFCSLMSSGDRDAMMVAADAGADVPQFNSDSRAVRIAAAALTSYCPRFT